MSRFLHWVLENKQWLFSGAAVAVIGYVVKTLLDRRRFPEQERSTKLSGVLVNSPTAVGHTVSQSVNYQVVTVSPDMAKSREEQNKSTTPSARQIMDALESLPPFQRNGAAAHYIGLEVCWVGKLVSVRARGADNCDVSLSTRKMEIGPPYIYTQVSLREYPRLKILPESHPVWIRGKVARIKSFGIELADARLKFVD